MTCPVTALFGNTHRQVPRIGLGCMGMSGVYGESSDEQCIKTIHHAIDMGCRFLDTADVYGNGHNEQLVGKALQGKRDDVFLATKFGLSGISNSPGQINVNGKPDYVQSACENSLKRLNIETIDLYYLHRLDSDTPIEETVGAMARLVEQGKVRYLGLSEISAKTLKRACKIHAITAVQSEYSLWQIEPEQKILPTCRELGIAFVPYSPLGRGMLTGSITSIADLQEKDWRHVSPRFQGEAFEHNKKLVDAITQMAQSRNVTPSQISLAWLLSEGLDIFPIPGTKRIAYLEENFSALQVSLTPKDQQRLRQLINEIPIKGNRYPEHANKLIDES